MRSASLRAVESVHPLQFTGACLAANRLEFRYQLQGAGSIRSARLVGGGLDVALMTSISGLLHTPVPGVGGHFVLRVEAVSEPLEGAPPLPWHVGAFLDQDHLSDYMAAQPLDATIDLPGGIVITFDRLLRRDRSSVIFWSATVGDTGHAVDGELAGDMLAGSAPGCWTTKTYGRKKEHQCVSPAPERQPSSALDIRVNAVEHGLLQGGAPLVWCGQYGKLHVATYWGSEISVPAVRPAVLKPDLDFTLGGLSVRLEEVWLGSTQTVLIFGKTMEELDPLEGLSLEDNLGRIYRPIPDLWQAKARQFTFDRIPASASRLVVKCQGAARRWRGDYRLPLQPGAKGFIDKRRAGG